MTIKDFFDVTYIHQKSLLKTTNMLFYKTFLGFYAIIIVL